MTTLKSSPFAPSTSLPGNGTIIISLLPPSTPTLSTLNYTYPLKLISSSPTFLSAGLTCLQVFLLTYGGGLVAGDSISLSINLAPLTRLSLVTQGSTKIFKTPSRDVVSRQSLDVTVGTGAGLCYLPDPTQPFAESCFEQRQTFKVERGASLCALDWVSEGRRARGEKWAFWRWTGRNEVWVLRDEGAKLLLRDNVILDEDEGGGERFIEGIEGRMDGLGVFGTLILRGPLFESLGRYFLDEFANLPRIGARDWGESSVKRQLSTEETNRAARHLQEKDEGLLWTAAAVRGLVLVKFGAKEVEGARKWLRTMLKDEGRIQKNFGESALLCLR
ncbi:MAG: hypothetical protein M1835_008076 [Candelina submexicana]|nr:MAG: hypothetical protein M1835_008076 [Candelina submexicana]